MRTRKSMDRGEPTKPIDAVIWDRTANAPVYIEAKWTDRALRREVVLAQGVTEAALLTLAALACLADENGFVAIQTKDMAGITRRPGRGLQRHFPGRGRAGGLGAGSTP